MSKSINTSLKLDCEGLRSLFPEGSEARLELQKGVMNNFMSNELKIRLEPAVANAISNTKHALTSEFNKQLKDTFYNGSHYLSESIKREIHDQVHIAISQVIRNEIKKSIPDIELEIHKAAQELAKTVNANHASVMMNAMRERMIKDVNKVMDDYALEIKYAATKPDNSNNA